MRLRAAVVRTTNATIQRRATIVAGRITPGEQLRTTVRVEIGEAGTGFMLYHFDASDRCIADTWHLTLDEAKAQAKFEFAIETGDWTEITN